MLANISQITTAEFTSDYIEKNQPAILSQYYTKEWNAIRDWVTADGQPNLSFFADFCPDEIVPVAINSEVVEMPMKQFIAEGFTKDSSGYGKWYLKDWHFVTNLGAKYTAYSVPDLFQGIFFTLIADDWMNAWWDSRSIEDDFRFVYIGSANTWTPFHADVFRYFYC